jgi:transketolase
MARPNSASFSAAKLDRRSVQLREQMLRMLQAGKRGHVASAFSVAEIVRVLYDDIMRYDAANPRWSGRDRFILSKGHACMAQYVLLAEKGFFPVSELWTFCSIDSFLGGHPTFGSVPGVEASTGSLGHGLSIGVGLALAVRSAGADAPDAPRVFVVMSDGEIQEGSVWEGLLCASKHRLSRLTVMVDYNKQQSYGYTSEVLGLEPLADKLRAFGLAVDEVDGHDVTALRALLNRPPSSDGRPRGLICHTVKGRGIKQIEQDLKWHHKTNVSDEEMASLMSGLQAELS